MIILGLNAYHADASACLVVDGQLVSDHFPYGSCCLKKAIRSMGF